MENLVSLFFKQKKGKRRRAFRSLFFLVFIFLFFLTVLIRGTSVNWFEMIEQTQEPFRQQYGIFYDLFFDWPTFIEKTTNHLFSFYIDEDLNSNPASFSAEVLPQEPIIATGSPILNNSDDSPSQSSIDNLATEEFALVTRIIDGDTLEITGGQKVRLIGIDTPESGDCYFQEAKNRLSDLTLNKEVKLVKDVSQTDRYQRLLRYIFVEDVFINQELVAQGYANASSYPPDVKHQDLFKEAQQTARENQLGLWGGCE